MSCTEVGALVEKRTQPTARRSGSLRLGDLQTWPWSERRAKTDVRLTKHYIRQMRRSFQPLYGSTEHGICQPETDTLENLDSESETPH